MNKSLLTVSLLLIMRISIGFAQTDSIPYKIGTYDIKKQEKVVIVAGRLKVDPFIIVRLNKLRNIQQDLVPGQRIKIPVYPKGYSYEPEKVVIHRSVPLDDTQLKLLGTEDSLEVEEPVQPQISKEEAEDRLLMIDALLELNTAMLQGVKASMDTLNKEDKGPLDEKNIQAMLQRMKRSRDKVLLLPYLVRLEDSLTNEVNVMTQEKSILERLVNPPTAALEIAPVVTNDTLIAGTDTIVYKTITTKEGLASSEIAEVRVNESEITNDDNRRIEIVKAEKRSKKFRQYNPIDTIIIYDLGSIKPEPEKKKIISTANTVVKGKWDTARAINPMMDTSATNPIRILQDSTYALKVKIPNTNDSILIKPIRASKKEEPRITKTDSVLSITKDSIQPITSLEEPQKIITNEVKKDTTITTDLLSTQQPVLQQETEQIKRDTIAIAKKQSVGELAMASGDSIRRIKAIFFYKRAQRAMNEKNFRNAEQYLEKSVELSPNYYDAWFALAEMNALFGSSSMALRQYQTCYNIDSFQSKLSVKMGELYIKTKRKSEAYKSFSKAIELNPEDVSALMERAAISSDWKQYQNAIDDYDQVIKKNRSYHYAYKARGQVYVLNHNYGNAVDDFTRYLIFEPSDPSAYYYRGLAKLANNELLDGCLDLSTASEMGFTAATRAIKKSCQ